MRLAGSMLALLIALAACSASPKVEGVDVPDGFVVGELVTRLDRPTQIALAPDGSLVIAQLAGGERDGTGQVVRVDPTNPSSDPEVLVDGLLAPTGVAIVDGELWVMERNTLTRGPLDGGDRIVVAADLPFNGRSNGTLTVLDDGRVLFDTSGSERDGQVLEGSGRLWTVTAATAPNEYAAGFKHAYAHVDTGGTLWTTEVGDGRFDGEPPADELVAVVPGADHGWPRCVGNNRPVLEYGVDEGDCVDVPRSHALFEAGATPTSVAVAPWDPGTLLVALWNRGVVMSVPRERGDAPHAGTPFLTGIDHPQHLLARDDAVLVVDHGGGRILEVRER